MNLQQLEHFRVVAEREHITSAANELHLAQPALSKTIKSLEEELGVELFSHVGRNISLNENGRILLKYINKIDNEFSQMRKELDQNLQSQKFSITILLKDTPNLVVPLVQKFRQVHPEISVRLLTYNRQLNESCPKVDFELESSICGCPSHCFETILEEEMVLALPAGHPWSEKRIDLSDTSSEDFITLPSGYTQTKEFRSLCHKAGFSPKVVLESSDYFTIQRMIEAGVGLALVPQYSWGFNRNPAIRFARLSHPILNRITISWEKDGTLTEAGQHFRKFLTSLGGMFQPEEDR